ncbi:MAG: phosphotransferase [Actinomycetota bacterium]|nr:phosphotransferase [Actinomycetota bacterium]
MRDSAVCRRRQHLLAQLASGPTEAAFLHGDLIPDNILNTTAGLRAIDPFGLRCGPAFDLATFASRCPDPPSAMVALLAGYGNEPPRTPEWLEFCRLYTAHQAPFWNEPVPTGLQRFLTPGQPASLNATDWLPPLSAGL